MIYIFNLRDSFLKTVFIAPDLKFGLNILINILSYADWLISKCNGCRKDHEGDGSPEKLSEMIDYRDDGAQFIPR